MAANSRSDRDRSFNGSPPSDALLFAKAILAETISDAPLPAAQANAERERLEFLAQFSTRHEEQLRKMRESEAESRRQRKQLEWLASIIAEHERTLQTVLEDEAATREAQQQRDAAIESWNAQEAWDPAKHPRLGRPPNAGWWASTRGSARVVTVGDESRRNGSSSFLDNVIRRNSTIAELSGVNTPSMIASSRLAADLDAAGRLPDEVARAAAAGLETGGKAIVNGSATAIKNVATLGLDRRQLELIGVTKEDRDRGYDTAVKIATASGEVLIAVGTGGAASALSKGGTVARTASGALVVYDTAGNAVAVAQGVIRRDPKRAEPREWSPDRRRFAGPRSQRQSNPRSEISVGGETSRRSRRVCSEVPKEDNADEIGRKPI